MKLFLRQLFDSGAVSVPLAGRPFDAMETAGEEIAAFDEAARLDFPGEAPELDLAAAGWAAQGLAEMARLVIARELGEPEITAIFAVPCPAPPSAATAYSADLFLRYLPGLAEVVERLSPGDPMLRYVSEFGRAWPLSTVGMKLSGVLEPAQVDIIAGEAGLRQVYADRILERVDLDRLGHPAVDASLRAALGALPELCPAVAEKLGLALENGAPPRLALTA